MASARKQVHTKPAQRIKLVAPRAAEASFPQLQLSESVAMQLRERIVSGLIKKGEFLRVEAIAKSLGVSSTPVREGLLLLQSEAYVRLIPRRGFMVNSFSKDDLLDLFWAQAVIGGELAARAAVRMSKADVDRLAALQDAHDAAFLAKDPGVAKLGHGFHRAINLAAGSPRLALLLGSMTRQLPNRFYAGIEGQLKDAVDYHPRILKALRTGDADSARMLMHKHILAGGQHLVAMLERQGMWAPEKQDRPRTARVPRGRAATA